MNQQENEISDTEFAIQMIKIFIGIVAFVVVAFILWKINSNLTTIIKQNGQLYENTR